MNILIADDEKAACEHLSGLIQTLPGCHDVGHASDGLEAVYKAYDLDIDIVLMDVRMPRMSGLEAARHISEFERPTSVVFTTAYAEHALEAFNVHAAGFLTKPVQLEKLAEMVRCLQHQSLRKVAEPAIVGSMESNYICCRFRSDLNLIALNRVTCIHSRNKCTVIHHLDGKSVSEQPLKSFERRFGSRLIRVHRNALVNKAYVSRLERQEDGAYMVVLRDDREKLEVSRRSLPRVREYLHTFMVPRMAIRRREQFLAQYRKGK